MSDKPKKSKKNTDKKYEALPEHVDHMRRYVHVNSKNVSNTSGVYDPEAYAAYHIDNSFTLEDFKNEFRIDIIEINDEKIVFDMVGIDAPLANAFRRILISEIPTMAIEKVTLYQNTSIIQDEVLAHRIGLIPIAVDPRLFKYVHESGNKNTEENSVVFTIQIKCEFANNSSSAPAKYINDKVFSKLLKWIPQGSQAQKFADKPVKPVHDDILIAKLRPGQSIEAELVCEKGIGQTHAKWSPVATASYRLLPAIFFEQPITGDDADELVKKCPANVFDIEDLGNGVKQANVARPRDCTMCRECIREPKWEERVKLRRVRNHFIFSVESTGIYKAEELLHEACLILKQKCQTLLNELGS